MLCPVCRLPLLTVEVKDIELDYCAEDFGVWFDEGEIEALLESHAPILTWDSSGEKGKKRCPRCNAKMHLFYPVEGLELDICPNGDGIWFDAGEVEQLANALQQRNDRPHLDTIFSQLNRLIGGQR